MFYTDACELNTRTRNNTYIKQQKDWEVTMRNFESTASLNVRHWRYAYQQTKTTKKNFKMSEEKITTHANKISNSLQNMTKNLKIMCINWYGEQQLAAVNK